MHPPQRALALLTMATFALTACTTTAQRDSASAVSSWVLAADVESENSAILARGMTPQEVRSLLGKPYNIYKRTKGEDPIETWIYRRTVHGPLGVSSMHSGGVYVTVAQPTRFIDRVEIVFSADVLRLVRITRNPEKLGQGSIPER